ncbi:MAG: MazG family protein [Microbacteriaceae bacterium]|nr:MazG family protein [Microbacteriaceae bacterium]
MPVQHPAFDELVELLSRLRGPGGCAWDGEQTHESLARYLIEECFELVEAIEARDRDGMLEELGDVLYQVLFHADIAAHTEDEGFDIEEVAARLKAKMIGRHPHVFDAEAATRMGISSGEDVAKVWDQLKTADKPERKSVLEGIPISMPSLLLAEKVSGKAAKIDIDLPLVVVPESEELLGELLLQLVNSARLSGLDAERSLRGAVRKLAERVREAEAWPG